MWRWPRRAKDQRAVVVECWHGRRPRLLWIDDDVSGAAALQDPAQAQQPGLCLSAFCASPVGLLASFAPSSTCASRVGRLASSAPSSTLAALDLCWLGCTWGSSSHSTHCILHPALCSFELARNKQDTPTRVFLPQHTLHSALNTCSSTHPHHQLPHYQPHPEQVLASPLTPPACSPDDDSQRQLSASCISPCCGYCSRYLHSTCPTRLDESKPVVFASASLLAHINAFGETTSHINFTPLRLCYACGQSNLLRLLPTPTWTGDAIRGSKSPNSIDTN